MAMRNADMRTLPLPSLPSRASRALALVAVVSTALPLVHPRAASAQTAQLSEAERKAAARSLFTQGTKDQDAGRPAEALVLFQKAQKLYDAPTHLLHIAQCQVLTGKLVDAAETYETLKRVQLAPGAPEVFVQAKAQAEADLPSVRARIPNLKIDLTPKPERLQNLQVIVNDVLLPGELVGVARPVNPGVAKIVARADGYASTTLEVTIREKETRSVALSLTPGASAPLVAPAPGPQPQPQPYYPPQPQPYPAPPPYNPNLYSPENYPKEPTKPTSTTGIIAGAHIGVGAAFGSGVSSTTDFFGNRVTRNNNDVGFSGGADFLFRFAKVVLVGGTFQVAAGDRQTTYMAAARLSFLTHPERFAFTAGVLAGGRGADQSDWGGTFGGTLGFSIPIGTHFRLDPRMDITGTNVGGSFTPFAFFGIAAAFNHNFAPKAAAPAPKE